ncbi:MAG: hypothetical protein KAT15_02375, partial [Bacteroidales bacterium]|nr:hypothetical protein [Bacteroidales bacterium]
MRLSNILITGIIVLACPVLAQESAEKVNIQLNNDFFEHFVEQVEVQTSLRIYYRNDWFEEVSLTYSADSVTFADAMYEVLKGTGLHFSIINRSRVIILPDGRLNMNLPILRSGGRLMGERDRGQDYLGVKADQYLVGTRPEQITRTIVVGDRQSTSSRSIARVKGRLINIETGEPVAGATMVDLESGKGSVSDHSGHVSMALTPGKHSMRFSFIGMEPI